MEIVVLIIILAIVGLMLAGLWKIAEKAGRPGWNGIIPIYNMFVFAELGGKPMWWGALTLIPYAGIVFQIWIWNRLVKSFGKSEGFTVGIILLPMIFIPLLGFGDAQYTPPGGGAPAGGGEALDSMITEGGETPS